MFEALLNLFPRKPPYNEALSNDTRRVGNLLRAVEKRLKNTGDVETLGMVTEIHEVLQSGLRRYGPGMGVEPNSGGLPKPD